MNIIYLELWLRHNGKSRDSQSSLKKFQEIINHLRERPLSRDYPLFRQDHPFKINSPLSRHCPLSRDRPLFKILSSVYTRSSF